MRTRRPVGGHPPVPGPPDPGDDGRIRRSGRARGRTRSVRRRGGPVAAALAASDRRGAGERVSAAGHLPRRRTARRGGRRKGRPDRRAAPRSGCTSCTRPRRAGRIRCSPGCRPAPRPWSGTGEEIVDLPPRLRCAVRQPATLPNQAFRVGAAAWGAQFHPEVLTDGAAAWARSSETDLHAVGLTVNGVRAEVEANEPELRRVWGELAARWMRVVTSRLQRDGSDERRGSPRSRAR